MRGRRWRLSPIASPREVKPVYFLSFRYPIKNGIGPDHSPRLVRVQGAGKYRVVAVDDFLDKSLGLGFGSKPACKADAPARTIGRIVRAV